MVSYSFNPSTWETRGTWICEFNTSLVYIEKPCLKKQQQKRGFFFFFFHFSQLLLLGGTGGQYNLVHRPRNFSPCPFVWCWRLSPGLSGNCSPTELHAQKLTCACSFRGDQGPGAMTHPNSIAGDRVISRYHLFLCTGRMNDIGN